MPFLASVSARQGGFLLANAANLPAPTFGASSGTAGGYTFSITNYSALNTYTLSVTNGGSATQSSGTVTVTGLANATTATCTVTVNRSGFVQNSANTTGTSFSKLATPTLSAATSTADGFTFTITNYDAANTYNVTTSAGSVSRSGGTVTQAGLAYSTSATVSVTASRAGFVTSDVETRAGTSSVAPPFFPFFPFFPYFPPPDPCAGNTCVGDVSYGTFSTCSNYINDGCFFGGSYEARGPGPTIPGCGCGATYAVFQGCLGFPGIGNCYS